MNNLASKKSITLIIIILIILAMTLGIYLGIIQEQKTQAAAISQTYADFINQDLLLDGYENMTDVAFNGNILRQIYQMITGKTSATYTDVNTAANSNRSSSGGAIHSGLTAAQIKSNNPTKKNIVVTFGGKQWIITSLSTNSSNQPILTMMLRDSTETSQWNTWKSTNTSAIYLDNVYTTSFIRANLLNGKTATGSDVILSSGESTTQDYSRTSTDAYQYDIFAHNSAVGSVTKYLEKPVNVPYQTTENNYDLTGGYCAPNDSLGQILPASKWNTADGADKAQTKSNYADWGEDYIWLPSQSEVGWSSSGVSQIKTDLSDGIWQLDAQTRSSSTDYWLRSGALSNQIAVRRIDTTGNITGMDVTSTTYTIRPCIHLNLKLAEDASLTTLSNPTSISTVYNGQNQGVGDVSSASGWYDAIDYGNSSTMRVEYIKVDGTTQTSLGSTAPKDAGNYKIKFTVLDTKKFTWTTGTDAEKEIDYTIYPKSLRVNWNPNVTPPTATPVTEDLCSSDNNTTFIDNLLKIKYSGDRVSDPYTFPDKVGNYTATVEIDESVSKNYELDKEYTTDIPIDTKTQVLPTFGDVTPPDWFEYNSEMQTYELVYNDDYMEVVKADPSDDRFEIVGGHYINVKDAGVYTDALRVVLKNPYDSASGEGFNVWDGASNDSSDKYITFEIKKRVLTFEIVATDGIINAVMGINQNVTIRYGTSKPGAGESAPLNYSIIATRNSSNPVIATAGVSANSPNSESIELDLSQSTLPVNGDWTLSIKADSSNYDIVLASPVTLSLARNTGSPDIIWWLMEDGVDTDNSVNAAIGNTSKDYNDSIASGLNQQIVYNGKKFEFYVTTPSGYSVDNTYNMGDFNNGYCVIASSSNGDIGTNADSYTTQVRILTPSGTSETYELNWTIERAKFDLSAVKWKYDGKIPYSTVTSEMKAEIDEDTLPKGLVVKLPYIGINSGNKVGDKSTATVSFDFDTSDPNYALNYLLPKQGDTSTYDFTPSGSLNDFEWSKDWEIVKMQIALNWKLEEVTDSNGEKYQRQTLVEDKNVVEYEYYLWDTATNQPIGNALSEADIEVEDNVAKYYVTKAVIKSIYQNDVEFSGTSEYSQPFTVGVNATAVEVTLVSNSLTYNGNAQIVKLRISGALSESDFDIVYYDKDGTTPLDGAPKNAGQYRVEISLKSSIMGFYLDGSNVNNGVAIIEYEIKPMSIDGSDDNWTDVRKPPSLQINKKELAGIEYEYADMDGNLLTFANLTPGNSYKIRAVIKDKTNYAFADGTYETDWQEFSVSANEVLSDPSDPSAYPDAPDDDSTTPDDNTPSGNNPSGDATGSGNEGGGTVNFGNIEEFVKQWWQVIASVISIILIIIFLSKTAGYESKRKKFNKKAEKLSSNVYAVSATGLFGLATTAWTAIACVLMGLAVASLVIMLIAKSRCNKAEENYEEAFEEYQQKKEENLRMMLMGMGNNGGMAQGYTYAQQPAFGMDEMRGLISETVTALLPGMQQMLPQQASGGNDELVQKLVEQNEKLVEKTTKNEEAMQKLINKIAQQPVERTVEKEVVASSINEEAIRTLIEGQRIIMEKLANQSAEPQVVEKVIEKEVPVEKIVEVPVEKVVEKVVEKEVKVTAPAKPKAEKAPRLTLDEAYAKLTKTQQKYFDGLREYALTKDKCKEKKSTYFILFGQSSVNPLVKLTIKKDTTVALFKMEDEYLKDIKRDATSDGTKVKVKETEVIISDAQSCKVAKNMIDLREDQIERYADLLREQRGMRNKK